MGDAKEEGYGRIIAVGRKFAASALEEDAVGGTVPLAAGSVRVTATGTLLMRGRKPEMVRQTPFSKKIQMDSPRG